MRWMAEERGATDGARCSGGGGAATGREGEGEDPERGVTVEAGPV